MMKRIWTVGAALAALAASSALPLPAAAQQGNPPPLNVPQASAPQYQAAPYQGGQYQSGQYQSGQYQSAPAFPNNNRGPAVTDDFRADGWSDNDWSRNDDRRFGNNRYGDWRDDRGRIDFQTAQRSCSRAGIQEAWSQGYYSAQYEGGPRFFQGRGGWELRGRMRLHDRGGYRYVDTVCDVRRNGDAMRITFLR